MDVKAAPPAPFPGEWAIEAEGLTKAYRGAGVKALDNVTLRIRRGAIFGLLGPNGAGKSTFINILAGLVTKSAGQASIWGYDIDTQARRARGAIGVVPQELNMDPFFTPLEALDMQAGLYGVPRRERKSREILAAVGLDAVANAYARTLSGGMKRRLLVAKAMAHSPPVLVLDEPTAGVDIELRQQLWAYVRELNARGTTIVLTTHYLEEAEQMCDEIAIINRGQVVCCEPTGTLLKRVDNKELAVVVDRDLAAVPAALTRFNTHLEGARRLVFSFRSSQTDIAVILSAVQAEGLSIVDLTTEETELEDIFLQLIRAPEKERS